MRQGASKEPMRRHGAKEPVRNQAARELARSQEASKKPWSQGIVRKPGSLEAGKPAKSQGASQQPESQLGASKDTGSQHGIRKLAKSHGQGVREPAGISSEPGSLGARELVRNDGTSNDYIELGSQQRMMELAMTTWSQGAWELARMQGAREPATSHGPSMEQSSHQREGLDSCQQNLKQNRQLE